MPKLLYTRHLEFLILSIVVPLTVPIMVYFLDQHIHIVPPTDEATMRMMIAAGGTCLFLWIVITIAALGQTPGYGKYAWYMLALPVGTLCINIYFEVGRIPGLYSFIIALVATWLGSLAFCVKDWYDVNHQNTLTLTQERLR